MSDIKSEPLDPRVRVIRHEASEARSELVVPAGPFTEPIEDHIDRYLGKRASVLHEDVSDLVHIDIEIVEPTAARPYITLVTNGMSHRPMNAPAGAEEYRHAELVLALPPHWPLSQVALADERNYWPIRWLKELARLPHRYNSWLWLYHTVPNGNPPQPFAPNTWLCCVFLFMPILVPREFIQLRLSQDITVYFLSVVPIYREEMDFKLRKGGESLVSLLAKAKVNELLDIERPNVCKPGLFR